MFRSLSPSSVEESTKLDQEKKIWERNAENFLKEIGKKRTDDRHSNSTTKYSGTHRVINLIVEFLSLTIDSCLERQK